MHQFTRRGAIHCIDNQALSHYTLKGVSAYTKCPASWIPRARTACHRNLIPGVACGRGHVVPSAPNLGIGCLVGLIEGRAGVWHCSYPMVQ
jgi:hypothetical protein